METPENRAEHRVSTQNMSHPCKCEIPQSRHFSVSLIVGCPVPRIVSGTR